MIFDIAFGFMGLAVLLAIAYVFSNNKKAVNWQQVVIGLSMQIVFAFFVILTPWGATFFNFIGNIFVKIISFTSDGSSFIFGSLADQALFDNTFPESMQNTGNSFFFAFQVLPTIIFFSSLMAVLYHLGIMQKIVQGMAWVMAKLLKVSGAESISVAANVFIGQTVFGFCGY